MSPAEQAWFPFAFLALAAVLAVPAHFVGRWIGGRLRSTTPEADR